MFDTPDIKVLQINTNKNQYETESALQRAIELNISILAIQEAWLTPRQLDQNDFLTCRSKKHPNFLQIFPHFPPILRPRTMLYISRQLGHKIELHNNSPQDPDLLVIDITDETGSITLINIYSQVRDYGPTLQALPHNIFGNNSNLLLGDFNMHHSR